MTPANCERKRSSGSKTMTSMSRIAQSVMAGVAAMVLTATAVGAAVGPARAVETASTSLAAKQVSGQALA